QPRQLILEGPGEPRAVPGPRDRRDHHAMLAAPDPRRIALEKAERARHVQRPPAPSALPVVIAAAAPAADPAPVPLPPRGSARDDHLSLVARSYVLHHRRLQPKQPSPYPDTAHVAIASIRFQTVRSPEP